MATQFTMPKLAMAMNEGTINEWLVEEGQAVEQGQPIAAVETEKVVYEVEAPTSGLIHLVAEAGTTVDVEQPIALFAADANELAALQNGAAVSLPPSPAADADAEVPASRAPESPSAGDGGRIKASPRVKKLAAERGIDLAAITGSGPGGRIVERDLESAADETSAPGAGDVAVRARLPFDGPRRQIATRMQQSLRDTAQLTAHWECDITDLLAMRDELNASRDGERLSVNALLVRALVQAVAKVPLANSALVADEILLYAPVHVGLAVALPGQGEYDSTLGIAVLRDAQDLSLEEIDVRSKAVIGRLRSGQAQTEDTAGATITLSTTAGLAPPGTHSTPILNPPNAVLVGPSTPIERPAVHAGEIAIRTLLPISLTFDHRILDGEPVARFMSALDRLLSKPQDLLD